MGKRKRRTKGTPVRVWIGPGFRAVGRVTFRDELGVAYVTTDESSPVFPNRILEVAGWRLARLRQWPWAGDPGTP